ncbi:MAG: hypothetical protein PVS2B2_17960 [Candidatus Acidiferrum sp.]
MQPEIEVSLLTGGTDRHYAFGLSMALVSKEVCLDVVGSDLLESPEMHTTPKLNFLNLQGSMESASFGKKLSRLVFFYIRLILYAATAKPGIFHILWNHKLEFFDRTLLMFYYKLLGKKIVFTAHNVNAGKRDSKDTFLNRITLKVQYRLSDHIFVHTEKMKAELLEDFGIGKGAVTVIPFGINNAVPDTDLSSAEARRRLGIREGERVILFYGAIKQYKGLEYLVLAFRRILARRKDYRLIIAGERKKGHESYWDEIQKTISRDPDREKILQKIEFIPDEETELYFKAADVAALPYTLIFQSGVLFLAYSFGLPVIASDVGTFGEDIIEGRTGFICKPRDAENLALTIEKYFESELFLSLSTRRKDIREYANQKNSWQVVAEMTRNLYAELLGR